MDFRNFKPCLLIAMPDLADTAFAKTVVLLTEYENDGAYGFIINRETHLQLNEALSFSKGELQDAYKTYPLYSGGPVDNSRIWILYDQKAYRKNSGVDLGSGVSLAEEGQILIDDKIELQPNEMKVFHGSASWGAKQLESEIAQSSWITAQISKELIFDTPTHEIWEKAIRQLGVDPQNLHGGPRSSILN